MYTNEVIKFELNRPVEVNFSYNTPVVTDGRFGRQYRYGVRSNDKSCVIFATEKLSTLLQELGEIRYRTLEIEKKELQRGNDFLNYWVIRENGVDITPKPNQR